VLVTCGIWRNIQLLAFNQARLDEVSILQHHTEGAVALEIHVAAEVAHPGTALRAAITLSHQGRMLSSKKVSLEDGNATAELRVRDPKLWWPAGMGQQPLYEVSVKLLNEKGRTLDHTSRRIGLRTIKLLEPDKENPLRFEANGVTFFAKGANWIPADAFANRVTPEILRRYVEDAVAVNMNTLRFWGGGYYEEEALFNACDELGICVWLDFKFGCSSYPAFDDAFMHSVRQEARDNVRRLRHHPCIAVWCGNNEIGLMVKDEWSDSSMGRADYDKLFKKLLGDQVKELAPQANYVSGSPDCGDTHYWQVWHGGKTFDAYRSFTGFPSEFGFQSFPEPRTVRAYTAEADRTSVLTPVMEWHQRSPKGNEKIRDMIPQYFNPPKDFDSTLWLSQIVQAYGIKIGAEYWRQTMPKSMACVYWQYNDCWPVASWSSVDYFGRW
jgi:beta-mannosidase